MTSKPIYFCVYRITNLVERKHYYGYKSSSIHPSKVIGVTYFSSLKKNEGKEFIADQKENPQNYKYKIVQIFNSKEEALAREIKLHIKFDVKKHTQFYNKSNQLSTGFITTQTLGSHIRIYNIYTQEKKLQSINDIIPENWVRGIPPVDRAKIGRKGKIISKETSRKISESLKGIVRSKETCEKYKENNKGKVWVHNEEGKNFQFYPDQIPDGYVLGNNRSELAKENAKHKTGKVFYHNEEGKNKLFHLGENPPGYILGLVISENTSKSLNESRSGRIWVKNLESMKCMLVNPGEIPDGYVLGRLINKNDK